MLTWIGNTFIVLLGVSVLSFVLTYLTPGDLAENMLTSQGVPATQDMIEAMRAQLGLDRPLHEQYFDWLRRLLTGDLGTSLSRHTSIAADFQLRLPRTLALTVASLVLTWALAVPAGLAAAARVNGRFDIAARVLSYASSALPGFVTALLVLHLLGLELRWFPISASQDARGMVMPVLTLVIAMSGWYVRQIRSIALEEFDKPYIAALRIRGLGQRGICLHVLRNIAAPLCTLAGSSFGALLAGSAVVEAIFNWQGLGHYALNAIAAKDYPVIQAYVVWCALVFLVANILADLLAFALDPRLLGPRQGSGDGDLRRPARQAARAEAGPLRINHPDIASLNTAGRLPDPGRVRHARLPRLSAAGVWRLLLGVLILFVAAGVLAPYLTPYDPYTADIASALQAPGPAHLLGTDSLGRDILARVLAGILPTLQLALAVVACALVTGTLIGVISAMSGPKADAFLQRVTAVFQAFPEFILALAFAAMLGPGFTSAVISLTAAYWPRIARYARILTMQIKRAPFIQIARMNGVPPWRLFTTHIASSIGGPLIVAASSDLGSVILNLATLSFVGLGLPQPASEWGTMISEGRLFLQAAPWLVIGPGLALFLLTLTFNLFSDTSQQLQSVSRKFQIIEKGKVRQ